MSDVTITTDIVENVDIGVSLETGRINQNIYSVSDLQTFLATIPSIQKFHAYANRSSEADALLDLVGSTNAVNNAADFNQDGFTGDGVAKYIDSKWSANSVGGVWSTQMWCGWIKSLGDDTLGTIIGVNRYVDPNYSTFILSHFFGSLAWNLSAYDNAFLNVSFRENNSEGYNASAAIPVDLFVVYQWTLAGNIELWVNGRLVALKANTGSLANNNFVYELAENASLGANQFSTATLGLSGYGSELTPTQIASLYTNAKAYINRGKEATVIGTGGTVENTDQSYQVVVSSGATIIIPDITITKNDNTTVTAISATNLDLGVIDPFPSTWDEKIAQYGRGYNWPTVDTETNYRTGDAGWFEVNVLKPARLADNLKAKNSLDENDLLKNNNLFGNKNRYTNNLGGSVYDAIDGSLANYLVDNFTGIGYYMLVQSSGTWNSTIDGAVAATFAGFSDWVSVPFDVVKGILDRDANTVHVKHIFSNIGSAPYWISDTQPADSLKGYYTYFYNQFRLLAFAKTNSRGYLICRKNF